jgi:hypothetical protein
MRKPALAALGLTVAVLVIYGYSISPLLALALLTVFVLGIAVGIEVSQWVLHKSNAEIFRDLSSPKGANGAGGGIKR